MRPRMVPAVCLVVFALLSSCDRGPGGGRATDGIVIEVVPRTFPAEYWKLVHAGAVKAGRQLAVRIEWPATASENADDQSRLIEQAVKSGVAGIVVAPTDGSVLRGPVHAAAAAGVPVVAVDFEVVSDEPVSFISADDDKTGRMAGDYLAKLFDAATNGKRKVVMLRGPGLPAITRREEGFLDAMKSHPEIEVVSATEHGGAATQPSYDAGKKLLDRFKDEHGNPTIDGVFCPDESTSAGMLRALTDAKWLGKVKFVGSDASPELLRAVQDGQIQALVVQDPFHLGEMSVKALVGHLQGGRVDKRIDTGTTIVTAENLADPKIDVMLHPDPDRWLSAPSQTEGTQPGGQPGAGTIR